MSLRGLLAGVLMLTGLEIVVSSEAGAQRFGGLLTSIGRGVQYFLSPAVAAIPDRRPPASGGSSTSGILPKQLYEIPGIGGLLPHSLLDPFKGPITGIPFSPISLHATVPAAPTTTVTT